jgi:HAD superfamily hydrolase (TIGR01549 family)
MKYFTMVVTKEYGFKRKPDSEGFNFLILKYGMSRSGTLAVGDRYIDIQAARNANISSVLFSR